MRIAAFTGGPDTPSSRFRVRQYIAGLAQRGIEVTEFPARRDSVPPRSRLTRPLWAAAELTHRWRQLRQASGFNVCWIQREFLSTLCTLEPYLQPPRVFDVDDSIHLHRHGWSARKLAGSAHLVICGNAYLAEVYSRWCPRVRIVPTAVDTTRFRPAETPNQDGVRRIGWSGSSSGFPYLYSIEDALCPLLLEERNLRLCVMSDRQPRFRRLPPEKVEFLRWRSDLEVSVIQSFDVGIMPLAAGPWEMGKCAYKLLLYMACGVPVAASPVGMSRELFELGTPGLAARTLHDWEEILRLLVRGGEAVRAMGREGRRIAELHFSLEVIVPALERCLREVAA